MRLHENNALFRDAILATAQQMNIQPEFIEKDYWLTYAGQTHLKLTIKKLITI